MDSYSQSLCTETDSPITFVTDLDSPMASGEIRRVL